jgi:hypothetical protein
VRVVGDPAERWADAASSDPPPFLVQLRLIAELRLVNSGYVWWSTPRLPVSRRHTRELKDKLVRAATGLEPLTEYAPLVVRCTVRRTTLGGRRPFSRSTPMSSTARSPLIGKGYLALAGLSA